MNKTILILLFSILIISCKTEKEETIKKEKISLLGNWEYLGFGKAITINDSIVQRFHTSSVGNVQMTDQTVKYFFNYFTIDTLSNDTILLKDGVKTFKLFRSNEDFTTKINSDLQNDPKYNFEVLWNTFNEHYCYFKERNIDWNELYDKYESRVNSETKPIDLYVIFEKMLAEINDGHVGIDLPSALEEEYNELQKNNADTKKNGNNGELQKELRTKIVKRYLKEPKTFNRGSINFGKINENIGYLEIQNMVTMAHYHLPDSLSNDDFWSTYMTNLNNEKNYHVAVEEGTRFMMDSIVKDLADIKALIIDIRFNGGGFDDASVEILNHLVAKETDFVTKKVKLGEGFTKKQAMTLYPSKNTFNGKVYVLTSHMTASASEVLVLGIKQLDNSKSIGASTEGIFSDILHKKLPNGWTYDLSNMVYETMDGVSYENTGLEPDYKLDYPKNPNDLYEFLLEDLKDGDDAIEKVIEEIKLLD